MCCVKIISFPATRRDLEVIRLTAVGAAIRPMVKRQDGRQRTSSYFMALSLHVFAQIISSNSSLHADIFSRAHGRVTVRSL